MNRERIFLILTAIAAAGASLGAMGCSACPGSEVSDSFPKTLDSDTACSLATRTVGEFGFGTSPLQQADCTANCGDEDVNQCFLDPNYVNAFLQANPDFANGGGDSVTCPTTPANATLTCEELRDTIHWEFGGCPVEGRRPAFLEEPSVSGASAGAYLARCAHLEAASVVAFQVLADDLLDLGAPRDLIDAACEAEADEVRHAAAMTRLARVYGEEPPAAVAPPRVRRSALDIALENAVEGVVREAFGAAVALYQAERASDPRVRSALRPIAAEECAHAALALRVAAFLDGLLSDAERALVEEAKRAAIEELFASLEEPPAAVGSPLGLPGVAACRRMLDKMRGDLWALPLAA